MEGLQLKPEEAATIYRLAHVLPRARLRGQFLRDAVDVRDWLMQLAVEADPDGRVIPLDMYVWPR